MKTYFISGVNGVGKSTLIPLLRELLSADNYVVCDFDQRGVPEGGGRDWRMSETKHWLEEAARNAAEGKATIVCGFAKQSDFEPGTAVEVIVLDATPEIIRERLVGRYTKDGVFDENQKVIGKPVQEFIDGNVWYASQMRKEAEAAGSPIIDTSALSPEQVVQQVVAIITSKI